jgi:hypothetical protein
MGGTSIEEELAAFGIHHERDENTEASGKHVLWQGKYPIGHFDAHEAVALLHELRKMEPVPSRDEAAEDAQAFMDRDRE